MPSPAPSRFTLRTALRRFRGNRRGSAAVEFALVAPIFFALLFAIIETALMFFASQVLETITQSSARVVLTGQAQSGSVTSCAVNSVATPCTQATFKTYVCAQIPALFDCSSLNVDVQSYSNFSSVTLEQLSPPAISIPPRRATIPGSSGQSSWCGSITSGRCS